MKFSLDPVKNTKQFLQSKVIRQKIAMNSLLDTIKLFTPEDKWLMLDSYFIEDPKISWFLLTSWIWNTAVSKSWYKYPDVVDKWAWKIFSYQKPKWNRWRYVWDGTHLFARSIAAKKDYILSILKS